MASPSPAGAATTSPHPPSCSCIYDGDGGRPRSIAAAVRQLVREGQRRWLKTREVVTLLLHHDEAGLALATVPPCNPPSGAMFVFEKEQVPRFRQDGVSWKTKRERNVIRENHETLMLDRHEMLVVSYAHSADVPGFHRRCYALLADRNRVLVHYLLTHPPPQPATAAPVPVPAPAAAVASSPVVDGLSAPASPFAPFDSSSVHEPQLHLPNQPYAEDASEGEARVAPVTAATPTWQPRRSVHVQTSLFGTGPLLSSSVPASPLAPAPARTPSPSLAMGTAALMPAQGPSAFEPQHASLSPWAAEFDMAFAHGAAAAAASAATPTPAAAASSPSPWQPFYEALEPTEARLPWHAESRVQLRPLLHAAKRDCAATGSTAPPACAFVEGEHELSDMQLMQLAAGELPLELRLTTDETLVSSSPPSPSRSESVAYEPPPEPAIDLAPAPSNSREDTTGAATPEQQPDEPQQQSHEPQQQQQQWRSEIRTVAPRWVLAPGGVQVVIVCDTALSDVLAATSATTSASTVVCRFGDVLTEATLVAPNVVSTVCPSFSDEADVAVSVGVLSPNGRELYDLTDAVAFKYHSLESLVREYEFPGSQPQQQQQQQQHMMVLQEGHSSSAAAALQSTAIDDAQVPPLSASASLSSTSAAAAALELVQSSGLSTEALLTLHSLLDHGVSSGNGGGGGGGGSGHSSGILMLGSEAAALEGAHDYDEIVARFECAITQVCQRMDDRPDRINKQDEHGRTLLHYSALLGYQTMTQLLLQIGGVASLSIHDAITGGTPLHAACTAGHAQLVRLMVGKVASVPPATALPLLRMRSSTGKTPLQVAVACSRRDIAQILTDAEVTVLQRLAAAESQRNSSGSASPVWAASGFSSSSSSSSASSGSSSVSLLSSPLSPASRGTTVTSPGPLLSLSLSQVSVGDGANSSIEPPAPSMEEAMNTIQCLYKAHQGRRKKLEHEEQVLQQAVIKIQASFRRYLVSKQRKNHTAAAQRIQRAYRSYRLRKSLKDSSSARRTTGPLRLQSIQQHLESLDFCGGESATTSASATSSPTRRITVAGLTPSLDEPSA